MADRLVALQAADLVKAESGASDIGAQAAGVGSAGIAEMLLRYGDATTSDWSMSPYNAGARTTLGIPITTAKTSIRTIGTRLTPSGRAAPTWKDIAAVTRPNASGGARS